MCFYSFGSIREAAEVFSSMRCSLGFLFLHTDDLWSAGGFQPVGCAAALQQPLALLRLWVKGFPPLFGTWVSASFLLL